MEDESVNILPYSTDIKEYLTASEVIDFKNESVAELSNILARKSKDKIDYIKLAYEYVRDNISHSADIGNDIITCTASEVLNAGHGICFAKSHLLAGLLRHQSIPSGFCYQKLILDDETAPILIYHGLNGVYIEKYEKWVRLDARGNKDGVDAQFSIDEERLAFSVRPEMGERDIFVVYPEPDKKVLEKLRVCKTRTGLWDNLPEELASDSILDVNGRSFSVIRLLGKGKGGYSYLVSDGQKSYVLKQIHHEPCDYYQFGNKLESEINDYKKLKSVGIRIPEMLDVDIEKERILKEFIDGETIFDLVLHDKMEPVYLEQVKAMRELLYADNINIDYFPTNFVVQDGEIFYIDFECNDYMEEWNFENWGIKYWSKTVEFMECV